MIKILFEGLLQGFIAIAIMGFLFWLLPMAPLMLHLTY